MNRDPEITFDDDPMWPLCPDGCPQEVRHPLGFRERSVRELELRVALGPDDDGVCRIGVDEREHEVHVRVLVHVPNARAAHRVREAMDCPVRVWLECPLGDRIVIDADTGEELLLFVPSYLDNEPQPEHGYWPLDSEVGQRWRGPLTDVRARGL